MPARVLFVFLAGLLLPVLAPSQEDLAERMEQAIAMLRNAGQGEPETIAMMLNSAAEGYIQKEDFDTALARVEESLQLSREHDLDPSMPFFTASKILSQTDDEAARGFLLRELMAPEATPTYKKGVLKALELHLAVQGGDRKLAIQAAHESRKLAEQETPGTEEEFWALFNYGNQCLTGKLYDVAGPTLLEASKLAATLGKPELAAHCARSLGYTLSALQKHEEALARFEESLALVRQSGENTFAGLELRNIATTLIQLGRLEEAAKATTAAREAARNDFEIGLANGLFAAIELKRALGEGNEADFAPVIERHRAAVEEKLKNDAGGEAMAKLGATGDLIALAACQIAGGDLEGAEASLAQAAEGADAWEENAHRAEQAAVFNSDQVNLSLTEIRSGIYEFREQIDLAREDVAAALVTTENGRGVAQAELMREKLGLPTSERTVKELDAPAIGAIAAAHDSTLVVYSLAHRFAPESRRFFRPDERFGHPQRLHTWVVNPDGSVHFRGTPLPGPISEMVERARREILNPPEEPLDVPPVETLSRLLIHRIADLLPGEQGSHITFIPDGPLFLVPFAALVDPEGTALIENHVISQSASIEMLELAREQKKAVLAADRKDVLLVGNPTMPGYTSRPDRRAEALSPLPGAEAEAKFLAKVLETTPLIGDEATEVEVARRMPEARFLHFATHGLLEADSDYNQSLLSALAFAPAPGEDGFLTVRETARLDLKAELAVLSACDTGRGKISGDGVIGLARGYLSAGVPTVIVSLWPVSDQATAVLMGAYYQFLQRGQGKAAALRSAILHTREKFPAPNLWAPFVLYGLPE